MRVALVRMVDARGADRQDSERDQREREKKAGKTKALAIFTFSKIVCNQGFHLLEIENREGQLEDGQRGESQAHELERLHAGVRILKGKSEEARRQVQLRDCLEQADAESTS